MVQAVASSSEGAISSFVTALQASNRSAPAATPSRAWLLPLGSSSLTVMFSVAFKYVTAITNNSANPELNGSFTLQFRRAYQRQQIG